MKFIVYPWESFVNLASEVKFAKDTSPKAKLHYEVTSLRQQLHLPQANLVVESIVVQLSQRLHCKAFGSFINKIDYKLLVFVEHIVTFLE